MTQEEARAEINLRLQRETEYVLAIASVRTSEGGVQFLKEKLADNDKSIRLIGQYMETKWGSDWEKFYRENYWEKK